MQSSSGTIHAFRAQPSQSTRPIGVKLGYQLNRVVGASTGSVWPLLVIFLACTSAQAQTPISLFNNFTGHLNYKVIGGTLRSQPNPNSCTVNPSGTSTLSMPAGATVVAAYLYWAGSYNTTTDFQVRLDGTVINASRAFTATYNLSGTLLPFFSGFADVTTQVAAKGNGTYTFDSLTVYTGDPNCSVQTVLSGWAVLVVYQRAAEMRRSINVWDGFDFFRGSSITFNPSNFTIPVGRVDGRLTHITWEGDAENSGSLNGVSENLYFNGSVLSDAINPVNNQFNSASSELGLTNTYGVDIDSYDLSAYLKAGDSTVVSTYASGSDLVLLSCEIISTSDTTSADLQIAKTHTGGASLVAGSSTTFTLSVVNNGPDTAGTITVVDTLPTGANFVSASASGWTIDSSAKPRYVWQHAGLHAPGVTLPPINVTASLTHLGYPKIYNRASVSSPLPDRRPWNNSSLDSITILTPLLGLSSKTLTDLNGGSVIPKDTLRYTIKVKNNGNNPAPNVAVVDSIPAGLTVVPGSLSPAGTILGRVITFNTIASIPVGDSSTLTYRAVVDSSITGAQPAINTAHIRSLTVDQVVSATFTPVNAPTMSLQKVTSPGPTRPNDTLRYTIIYRNTSGLTPSTGTQVLDTLPSVVTIVAGSITKGGTWQAAPAPKGRIVWSPGTVNGGTVDSVSFKAVIDNGTPPNTVVSNTARLTNAQGSTAFSTRKDTVRAGATATITATPVIAPGDTMYMTVTDADLNKNSSVVESYVFKDSSKNGESENVTFTETGPGTGIFTGKIPTTFGLTAGANNNGIFNAKAGDTLTVTYHDTLRADGSSATITAQTAVRGGANATLTSNPSMFPRDTMFVTLTDADLNRNGGSVESYILKDSNVVTGEVENLTFTETGPNTGIFTSKAPTRFGSSAGTNNDGTFNVKAGDTLQVTYRDSLQANGGSAVLSTRTVVKGGFTATIAASPALMAAGDSVTFTLTEADLNKQPAAIDTVVLATVSSTGELETLTYVETGVNTGIFRAGVKSVFDAGPGPNNNGIFTVLPGDSIAAVYHDSLTAPGDTANIRAWVKIGSANFASSSKTYVDRNGGLAVPQDTIAYTITVRNTGPVQAASVSVVDTVPLSLTVVPGSISGGGVLAGRIITFAPFTLIPGDSVKLTYTVTIDTSIQDQSSVNNIARITASGIVQLVNVAFTASNRPIMSMTKTADRLTPLPGDTVLYTIAYSNIGTGTATNVAIIDTISNTTSYVPQTVSLNNIPQTDQADGDEVVVSAGVVRVSLNVDLKPGQGGTVKFKVRVN
jgi:uncharacterized repeat protein (TIGR01451 family)